jgi:hypothetical protein
MIQIKDENGISLIKTSLTYKWNSSSFFAINLSKYLFVETKRLSK